MLIVATYKSDKPTNVDYVYCGGDICLLQLDDACYQDDERINGDEIAKRIKDVNNGAASNISIICNGGRGGFTTTKDDEEGKAGGSGGDVKCYCGQSSSQTLHVTQTITGCAGGKTVEDTKDGESGGGYDSRAEEVAFRASNVDHGDLIDTITIKYAGGEGGSCKIQNYGGGAGGGASCFGSGGNGGDSQQSARSVPETSYGAGGGGAGGATSNHLKYGATGGCAVFTISYGWHNEN